MGTSTILIIAYSMAFFLMGIILFFAIRSNSSKRRRDLRQGGHDDINELKERVLELERKLDEATRNGPPRPKESSTLGRLAERGDNPRGR